MSGASYPPSSDPSVDVIEWRADSLMEAPVALPTSPLAVTIGRGASGTILVLPIPAPTSGSRKIMSVRVEVNYWTEDPR